MTRRSNYNMSTYIPKAAASMFRPPPTPTLGLPNPHRIPSQLRRMTTEAKKWCKDQVEIPCQCCPVKTTIHRVRHDRAHGATQTTPIAAYYCGTRRTAVNVKDATDVLRCAMAINYSKTDGHQGHGNQCLLPMGRRSHDHAFWPHGSGPHTKDGSLDSILCMRYLHIQSGTTHDNLLTSSFLPSFLPDETVPIIGSCGDDSTRERGLSPTHPSHVVFGVKAGARSCQASQVFKPGATFWQRAQPPGGTTVPSTVDHR
jgi:hypothetical protein